MIEITYPYPIAGVTDLEARLTLAGAAVTGADWQTGTAVAIRGTHAGYEWVFADTEADTVELFSVSQVFATEIALPLKVNLQPVLDAITANEVDLGDLPADVAALRTDVARLGKAQLVIMSPVLANGNARITRGSDYFISEGRSLDFEMTGPTVLAIRDTIASITFTVENAFTILNVSHEAITDGVLVRVELTSAQTLELASSSAGLQINAIMQANGHVLPLLQGTLTVDKAIA